VPRSGEPTHIRHDLRQDLLSSPTAHARDRVQPVKGLFKRAHSLRNLLIHLANLFVQEVDKAKLALQQQPLMRAYKPPQGRLQLGPLPPEPALGQSGQHPRVLRPLDESLQHGPP